MSKRLSDLLKDFTSTTSSLSDISITHVTNNSRDVTKNTLFLAYPGEKVDGRCYCGTAIAQGVAAICYEPSDDFTKPTTTVPCIAVPQLKIHQSTIAARFYDFPSHKVPVIGVTGTNGKTSITHFIAQAMSVSGECEKKQSCGVIGTIGYGVFSVLKKLINTTPDGLQLQKIFSELLRDSATAIAMEVSSHALSEQRVNDVQFHTVVFTNLTQDHLDYHGTMERYRDAKELLFKNLSEAKRQHAYAVINIDDDTGKYFAKKYRDKLTVMTYSLHDKNADIYALKYTPSEYGFDITVKTSQGTADFHLPLLGEFNIHNALAVMGVLLILKMPFDKILMRLSQLKTVNGRMMLMRADNQPTIIVDYAHTPDALEKVLQQVRTHCAGQLWCVFGCGGDRDKTKRPLMGLIADQCADHIIITNDNPRSETPEIIAQEILAGAQHTQKFMIELDRKHAISQAIQSAEKKDWIVIAGKGHETEQIIGTNVLQHNDSECVMRALRTGV